MLTRLLLYIDYLLLRVHFHTDFLLAFVRPLLKYFAPVLALLLPLFDLLVSPKCSMAALGSDLAFGHSKVVTHCHHHFEVFYWVRLKQGFVVALRRVWRHNLVVVGFIG